MSLVRRLMPWVTPAVVAVEVIMVSAGILDIASALIVFVVVELAVALTVGTAAVRAAREYRHRRRSGVDVWRSSEDALSTLMPRRLATFVVLEPRLFCNLLMWACRRPVGGNGRSYTYTRGLRVLFGAIVGVTVVESVIVELVLVVVDIGLWIWLIRGINLYAVLWLLAVWASLQRTPHRVTEDEVRLHDGLFGEVRIRTERIRAVRTVSRPVGTGGRSGVVHDVHQGTVVMCYGAHTSVDLLVRPESPVLVDGQSREGIRRLSTSVDDPDGFVRSLRDAIGS